ncbi:MAG TPA: hypothetical protein PLZ58_04080 [Candidatus Saccharibacteria bacterium]|nr:hypothetical protein [Candidatus Saccharibacteria bacterium]
MLEIKAGELAGIISVYKGTEPDDMPLLSRFNNLITDNGLRLIGSTRTYISECFIGSGSSTPVASQTSLDNMLSYSNSNQSDTRGANTDDPLNQYVYRRVRYRFSPTGSAYNVSEIAFGDGVLGDNLFNRALAKDTSGSPTTISVLGDEYLDVELEIRVYPPLADMTGSFAPTGKDTAGRTWTARAAGYGGVLTDDILDGWSAYGNFVEGRYQQSGGYGYASNSALPPIFSNIPNSFILDFGRSALHPTGAGYTKVVTAGLEDWNTTIRTVKLFGNSHVMNIEFDPPFVKTNKDIFKLTYTVTWGRRA